ncbi:MAG: hypothetical protein K0R29_1359 [Pseudobdellovibrio sp.]|jgi:putative SOS response-associated peptidase YedK|nr:hypothetical protein [Pseudobdellovibrio sp.]
MCSNYTVKVSRLTLKSENPELDLQMDEFNERLHPGGLAPVVVLQNSKQKVTPMRFSMIPSWSKEPKVKFATHNARIESITEKPAWRLPFQSQHCHVPVTAFYESVYTGPFAGNVIKFTHINDELLWSAGIFDFWKPQEPTADPEQKDQGFFSFAILTREPSKFILDHGHDRTPIFVQGPQKSKWLNSVNKNPGDIVRDLLSEAYHPELKVEIERPLKPGWEKRAAG